jgi:hypothetical protein
MEEKYYNGTKDKTGSSFMQFRQKIFERSLVLREKSWQKKKKTPCLGKL